MSINNTDSNHSKPPSSVLAITESDVQLIMASGVHLGTQNLHHQMQQYVYKRIADTGVHIIHVRRIWTKLQLAARAIVAVDNPGDVCAISSRLYGQRAVLKFAQHTGAWPMAGRFTPGTFTNQIQKNYREPLLLVVADPRADHQAITESAYCNIPVIAMCDTDSPMRYIDIAIPCNNRSVQSVGVIWWLLAREVLRMRGSIGRSMPWNVMVDLFLYREAEEPSAVADGGPDKDPLELHQLLGNDGADGRMDGQHERSTVGGFGGTADGDLWFDIDGTRGLKDMVIHNSGGISYGNQPAVASGQLPINTTNGGHHKQQLTTNREPIISEDNNDWGGNTDPSDWT
ncbi:40S ribosomal protein SA-like [Oppia nitens]|uniref:40S ribosomal protein SA-like n=1 Tax=Oppia nitens TaxID=1686743 RepID=UPI0023DB608D|nr:40S ribosomal protein SA-like [Oppia nitens]